MSEEELKRAKELIEAERAQREEQCRVEMEQVLAKHHCALVMQPQSIDAVTIRIIPIIKSID